MAITVDATKGWARPANAAEWTELLSGTGLPNPDSSWDCTEGSGNLADDIGSLTLTAAGVPAYGQAVAGWSGTGVGVDNANDADRFTAASGVGPSPATTSQFWLFVMNLTSTPTANRVLGSVSTTGGGCWFQARIVGTSKLRINCNGNTTDSSADLVAGDYVFGLMYDRAASRAKVYSTLENLSATYSSGVVDGPKGLFAGGQPLTSFLIAMWSGANAEGLDDTDIATIFSRIQSPPVGGAKGHYYRRLVDGMRGH